MAWLLLYAFQVALVVLTIRARRRAAEAVRQNVEVLRRLSKVETDLLLVKENLVLPDENEGTKAKTVDEEQVVIDQAREQVEDLVVSRPEYAPSHLGEIETPPAGVFSIPEKDEEASVHHWEPSATTKSHLDLERFLGVKLFAWAAGLALFLGVAFFLKWSFDQGVITPPVRVAMGIVVGLGLLIGGLRLQRDRYAVLVQALTAAGVLVLYADIFASCSFYQFIGQATAFMLMSLVTATAFLLAARLGSPTVAILGLLGGFLTPPLLSTGVDRPVGLFSYIALLDIGLLAVTLYNRWNYLSLLSAAATVVMQIGWAGKFFEAEKTLTGMGIFLAFAILYMLALFYAHRRNQVEKYLLASCLVMPAAAIGFAFYLLVGAYPVIVERPWLFFGFAFVVDAVLLAQSALRVEFRRMYGVSGAGLFVLLVLWTVAYVSAENLDGALAAYLVYALLHSIFPVVLQRLRPSGEAITCTTPFPVLSLVLVTIPILWLSPLSLVVWPAILLIDALAIILAFLTASVRCILAVMAVTVLATVCWIFKMPQTLSGLPEVLIIIGGFAILFFIVGVFASKRVSIVVAREQMTLSRMEEFVLHEAAGALIPALSALLPFLLLTLLSARLPLIDPSLVFGMAALMAILLLILVRNLETDWSGLACFAGVVLVESTWHFHCLKPDHVTIPMIWYVGFYLLFTLFPFVVPSVRGRVLPWVAAALAGPAQFFLIYKLTKSAFAFPYMGALPAVFAVTSLTALACLLRFFPQLSIHRAQVALFGGVALFFITVIFPIQLEKQWITISWALEGVALLWLLHRVPHDGLKWVGVALLITAFARLSVNPAVLTYHMRSETPIMNWYLYAYGIVTLCLFAGARLLAPPHNLLRNVNVPGVLAGLGTALAFVLINIEIADYFSDGARINFEFSGNLGRDMTYSLAWGVFAFAVLLFGILRQVRGARYAGIGLLVVTLVKLFLHDLWRLGGLYRIGSLVGLALVLIAVSFLYQRFISTGNERAGVAEERLS